MDDWKLGIVEFFDNDKGEGMVKSEGVSYYFHYSAIKSKDDFKTTEKGKQVKIRLYKNIYMTQIDALVEL